MASKQAKLLTNFMVAVMIRCVRKNRYQCRTLREHTLRMRKQMLLKQGMMLRSRPRPLLMASALAAMTICVAIFARLFQILGK